MPCDKELYYYLYQERDTSDLSTWYAAKHTSAWALYKTLCKAYGLSPSGPAKHFTVRLVGNDDSSYKESGDT